MPFVNHHSSGHRGGGCGSARCRRRARRAAPDLLGLSVIAAEAKVALLAASGPLLLEAAVRPPSELWTYITRALTAVRGERPAAS